MDETTLSLHPRLNRCWTRRATRRLIPAPGTPQFQHVFGAYNWRTGQVAWISRRKKNSDSFIEFLEHVLLTVYPDRKVILVMDNAAYHKSYASLAALRLFEDRVRVFWLPRYSPFLNPIERFWLQLKTLASANCLHRCMEDLVEAIQQTINYQNDPAHPDRLVFAKNFRLMA